MNYDTKNPIIIPEQTLDKIWIKRIMLSSNSPDDLLRATIYYIPYSSSAKIISDDEMQVIEIEDAMNDETLGPLVQSLISSTQETIDTKISAEQVDPIQIGPLPPIRS